MISINHIINRALDIFFPVRCVLCNVEDSDLCLSCLRKAPPAERESPKWIFPIYDYRHPSIKNSLRLFKYKGKKRLANVFAEVIYEKMMEELSDLSLMENFTEPILIPIPLSPKRRRERGFNQSELICRELIKINTAREGAYLKLKNDILLKPRETEHQARIKDRRTRLENMAGSFTVKNTELIKNKNIILIDDILTTGATLGEARKMLKGVGARKVIAFTVAH